jgi:hypothetical protein
LFNKTCATNTIMRLTQKPTVFTVLIGLGLLGLGVALAGTRLLSIGETRPIIEGRMQAYSSNWVSSIPPTLPYIPTYYRDVKPILEKNCVGCHTDGGIAPFSLDDPQKAVQHARATQLAVQTRRMPPWLPGGDSPKFQGDTRLTDDEITIIANWSWAGGPLGKVSDARPSVRPVLEKRTPDLSVDIGRDFKPDADLTDEYRCFLIDPKLSEARDLVGYNIKPGNARLVHHVLIFQATGRFLTEARQLEARQDGRGGWTCFGGPGIGNDALAAAAASQATDSDILSSGPDTLGYVGSWVPGQGAVQYPAGTGIPLKPGAQLVIQVHYNLLSGERGMDRTAAEMYFAQDRQKRKPISLMGLIAPVEIPCAGPYPTDPTDPCHRQAAYDSVRPYQEAWLTRLLEERALLGYCKANAPTSGIPAGKDQELMTRCDFTVNQDMTAYGTQGHMHTLGTRLRIELNPETDARKVLLDIPRWDFHWQSGYWFQQPVELRRGDRVRLTCVFDNSQQNQAWLNGKQGKPRYVVWGESTRDEMCVANLQTVKQ